MHFLTLHWRNTVLYSIQYLPVILAPSPRHRPPWLCCHRSHRSYRSHRGSPQPPTAPPVCLLGLQAVQRLVVGVEHESSALNQADEGANGCLAGQNLSVQDAVFGLCCVELPQEKAIGCQPEQKQKT